MEDEALNMSDEDFLDKDWGSFDDEPEETEELSVDDEAAEDDVDPQEDGSDDDADEESTDEHDTAPEDLDAPEEGEDDAESPEDAEDDEADPEEDADSSDVDYEAEYKKLLAPFKANGRNMQVESVDDALQLMKMGANYNKKMAAIKPNLKLMKMLDNNGLLDESKLSFFIDLEKGNPDAIKKFMSDKEVDTFDLDANENTDYKPTNYTVHEKELELDDVLNDIRSTPAFKVTADTLNNKWDDESRKVVVQNPEIMRVINDHVESGYYDQIVQVMEREKMLGRLSGISDIEAYRQIGDRLHAEGKFSAKPQQQSNEKISKPQASKPNPQVTKRKRAAASTKSSRSASNKPLDFNPLGLSDEDFEKQFSEKFL